MCDLLNNYIKVFILVQNILISMELNIQKVEFPIPDFKSFANRDRRNSEGYISKHYPELYSYLLEKYPDDSLTYKERLYMFLHSMEEPHRCPVCGKYTKLQDLKFGYRKYCSSKCCNSDEEKIKLTEERNLEKYGCKNVSSVQSVKDKVRDTMERKLEEDPELYKKYNEKRKKTKKEKYGDENYTNREKYVSTCMERYGVEHVSKLDDIKERKKNTLIEHYGVDHQSKAEEVKRKKREKSIERYGTDCPLQAEEVKDKIKKTNLDRYGVECTFQSKEIREKAKHTIIERYGDEYEEELRRRREETCMERYGVKNAMQNPDIRKKMEDTCIERYGVRYPTQAASVKKKTKKTNLKRYGVENTFLIPGLKIENQDSSANINFKNILESNGIIFYREIPLIKYRYDFKVGDTLIEISPVATHNSTFGVFGKPPKEPDYHQNKTIKALENGYRCITVWDWDNLDLIVEMLKPKEKVYARDCELIEVDKKESDDFLEANHLQGTCRGQSIRLGLTYNGELIEIMTFGKQRLRKTSKENSYELLRLCTRSGYTVTGGSERLFKRFVELYNPDSIISYCDLSKFSGDIYTRLGFSKGKKPKPSKHWFNLMTGQHITDNLLRQRGFDQLFKTNYGKGTSNEELMLEHGFVEIYDCGQAIYSWYRDNRN